MLQWLNTNGGLPSWIQAVGSLMAVVAVAVPVMLQRRVETRQARAAVLASAKMAVDLMNEVAHCKFDEDARYSEWWVPQWHVIDQICADCPLHTINSTAALEAFVTVRELYGRMRAWDENGAEDNDSMQSYVRSLNMNANMAFSRLQTELAS